MTEEHKDEPGERNLPDAEKLRRFSLSVGVALLIYVLAGGQFGQTVQTVLTPIVHFDRPGYLLGALVLASLYSSSRYWYYVIHSPQTRRKIRKFLRKSGAVLVFFGDEIYFEEQMKPSAQTETRHCLAALYSRLPPGLPRSDFQVITHNVKEPELVNEQVAKKLNKHFPGLEGVNVSVEAPQQRGICWAHVSTTSRTTDWWCWLEDFDLWLPIILNGVALVGLLVRETWPVMVKVVQLV